MVSQVVVLARTPSVPFVAVIVPMGYGYFREVLRGIGRYAGRRWQLTIQEPGPDTVIREMRTTWGITGAIGVFNNHKAEQGALDARVPCVNVSGWLADGQLPRVRPNDEAVGRLAAEHLMGRGYRHFAHMEARAPDFRVRRQSGFVAALAEAGHASIALAPDWERTPALVKSLPRPIGVLAYDDRAGVHMISLCLQLGIDVPGEVAVVGVDNDSAICAVPAPQLTSVDPAADMVGFESARLLDQLMTQKRRRRVQTIVVPPRAVVARASTDMVHIADPELSRVARLIRERACLGVGVKGVVAGCGVSRRTLERRFLKHFGRTIRDEVHRVQFEHAGEMLLNTDRKMSDIAEACGFGDARNFMTRFRKKMGVPPGRFRKQRRLR